jgi:hypothetical protein
MAQLVAFEEVLRPMSPILMGTMFFCCLEMVFELMYRGKE